MDKHPFYFLNVTSKGLELSKDYKHVMYVQSLADLQEFKTREEEREGPIKIMCSSSLDFPKDYTNDKEVINLAREIRK